MVGVMILIIIVDLWMCNHNEKTADLPYYVKFYSEKREEAMKKKIEDEKQKKKLQQEHRTE